MHARPYMVHRSNLFPCGLHLPSSVISFPLPLPLFLSLFLFLFFTLWRCCLALSYLQLQIRSKSCLTFGTVAQLSGVESRLEHEAVDEVNLGKAKSRHRYYLFGTWKKLWPAGSEGVFGIPSPSSPFSIITSPIQLLPNSHHLFAIVSSYITLSHFPCL